ncbi:unnamed protein product [Trichobilharzia regenti]|nr:unnamed protein product [Trichobilharzia regenti]
MSYLNYVFYYQLKKVHPQLLLVYSRQQNYHCHYHQYHLLVYV